MEMDVCYAESLYDLSCFAKSGHWYISLQLFLISFFYRQGCVISFGMSVPEVPYA